MKISGRVTWVVLVLGILVGASVMAGNVYLNGTAIDGVTNQKFKKVNVTIDARGDVYIEAKGYAVQSNDGSALPASQPVAATNAPSRRYWLVAQESERGMAQYEVDIYINSVWFRRVRSGEDQLVEDITRNLRTGANVLHFSAQKKIPGKRKSFAIQKTLSIIIGEGNMGGNNVMIENPLIQYSRNANETKNFSDDFTINVR